MKTRTAFLLRFLLPPLYAATVLALIVALFESNNHLDDLPVLFGAFTLYAYIFAGLPALLFALLMSRFARRRPAFGGRLLRATLLGLASGLLITAMFGFNGPWLFLSLGTAVGFLVEGTLVLRERPTLPSTTDTHTLSTHPSP
jgi:hypothetical protein